MSKTFFTVADDFDGTISIAGHPVAYRAGDVIVTDDSDVEIRDIMDLGTGDLSNVAKGVESFRRLAEVHAVTYGGVLSQGTTPYVWTFPLSLDGVGEGEVARCKPGFSGRVIGTSFIANADATTSGKAASFVLFIVPGRTPGDDTPLDYSDEIDTITVASGTTPFVLVVTDEDTEETFTTAEIAYNAAASAVKSALVTAGLATGDVTVSGTGPWTLTWTEDRANHNITVQILRNEIVTVVVDATGGSFTLDYNASGDPETINANASQAAFQAAVDALLAAAGNDEAATVVRSGSANSYTYTITGHDGANLSAFSAVASGLTGGVSAVSRTVVQQGGATNVSTATTVGGGAARLVGASGNPATLDLTSSNVSDGGVVAGETIATGSNPKHGNFTAYDEIVLSASGVTAFVEGGGAIVVYIQPDA